MGVQMQTTQKRKKKSGEKGTGRNEAEEDGSHSVDVFVAPTRECAKPTVQLSLTEEELGEEIAQMLTANNPAAPDNISHFHTKERTYKLEAMTHYATDGWLIAKDSDEGRKQSDLERLQEEAMAKLQAEIDNREPTAATGTADESKQLRNQFNFSDRACQTTSFGPKQRGCHTEPPKTTVRRGSCSQWEIYDAYKADIEAQHRQEQPTKRRGASAKKTKNAATVESTTESPSTDDPSSQGGVSLRAAKIMERMTVQNLYDEFVTDFRYWDDVTDSFRPEEASLLPLWCFEDEQALGKQVSAICTNPLHTDVFAVGYGSYDAQEQTLGRLSLYSIKNPTVPEMTVQTQSGVLAIAFHPDFPDVLALGCYDGSVRVMDARGTHLYTSESVAHRHMEPIWQVSWKSGTGSHELQLYSASTDGKLALWTFIRSDILFEPVMTISEKTTDVPSGVLSIDFNQLDETTYLAGTEEGRIIRCCTEYDSEYLDTFVGHQLPVYAVKWSRFHKDVFLSASEDWTVQLWSVAVCDRALLRFELKAPATDVSWAPYASTVFAAASADGMVYVFDVASNRHSALCEQRVVGRGRLTKLLFHPRQPLLLVGDTSGNIFSLKLSPNLRKVTIDAANDSEAVINERARLEHALDLSRHSIT